MSCYTSYIDVELLKLLKDGDHSAFTEIYRRYWDKLFYLAGKKLEDPHEAQCIVQDIFLDLWQRREVLEVHSALDGYLVVAVKYRILNSLARGQRAKAYKQKLSHEQPLDDYGSEQWLRFEDLRDWLETTVAGLPEKCQIAFRFRAEGLTQKEIAEAMEVSQKTVETHISKALKVIRANIGQSLSLFFTILL